jgi:hypothetical protein
MFPTTSLISSPGFKFPDDSPITLSCAWIGNHKSNEALRISTIDLIFKGVRSDLSIQVPKKTDQEEVRNIPFTRQIKGESGDVLDKIECAAVKLTIGQIRNLTLRAGFFAESPLLGAPIRDGEGRTLGYEKRMIRSYRPVECKIPQELQGWGEYSLQIAPRGLDLNAEIVKDFGSSVSRPILEKRPQIEKVPLERKGIPLSDLDLTPKKLDGVETLVQRKDTPAAMEGLAGTNQPTLKRSKSCRKLEI